jgi:hypothetical protein
MIAMLLLTSAVFAAKGGKSATVTIPVTPELFNAEPRPLTVAQCAQCHPGVFRSMKNDGRKHRFDCQKCHTKFHSYNPKKGGWDELMPRCAACHAAPHGKNMVDCASCHSNPHTPMKMVVTQRLSNNCTECHKGPRDELAKFPSKHSKLGCQKCHTSHGSIPSCFACHKPHVPKQELATCKACHPVHRPLQITYDTKTPSSTCGACHTKVYGKWQKSTSKHAKVACVECHQKKHKAIPKCTDCHDEPHPKAFLVRYPNCLSCHMDPHDPPAGKKK